MSLQPFFMADYKSGTIVRRGRYQTPATSNQEQAPSIAPNTRKMRNNCNPIVVFQIELNF